MCSCDFDRPQFYLRRTVRARKPHRCDECPATIQPGQTYELVTGKWDDHIGSFRTCARCRALSEAVKRIVTSRGSDCTCFSHGNLRGDMADAMGEISAYAGVFDRYARRFRGAA